ncbi:uncharacterized protein MONBRDRAFT_30595, partial [Monosiga brevicollis MX1]
FGWTPLHRACRNGYDKVVEMLLKHGADAKAKNNGGETPLDVGRHRGHGDKLEPVFAAHEARLSQPPAPLAPPTPAPPSAWLPPLPTTPTLETTASVVVAVDKWLKPLLPTRTTSHTLPHLDAFIRGAAKQNPNLATVVASIRKTIDEARPEFPVMDWAAFQTTTTQALNTLDQALAAPEALSNRLKQLDPNTDNLESVLQELHGVTAGFELQPVLLELQDMLAACPAPPTTPVIAPKKPPTDLAAALSKVIALSGVEPKRQELLTSANSDIKRLVLALIDALGAVARAGTTDTIHRVETLRQCAQCVDASAPPPAEALPEAWEELCQAHKKLSLLEQNGLEQIAQWQPPPDYEHQNWYLAFVHHESQALLQQLQDMIDWQATTLSMLDSCMRHVDSLTQGLEHPNIVPVLGALLDVHSGHPSAYLVQPWCTQGDLQQWLGKARHLATSTVVASLMTQLRMALAFMHSKGLVHRDVKLSNVMLDGEEDQPVVRLGDFDIAKAAAEATMLPCTATASSGTAGYVAPEVLFGRGRVGARPAQDAFSFGCVVYNTYMFPQTVPPAHPRDDEVVYQCRWSIPARDDVCSFPHLAAEVSDEFLTGSGKTSSF